MYKKSIATLVLFLTVGWVTNVVIVFFLCVSRSAPSYNYGINSVPFQTGRYFQAAAVVWVTHLGAKNHITVSMKSLIHLSCDRATYCMLVCV